jgi:hypothetical protein
MAIGEVGEFGSLALGNNPGDPSDRARLLYGGTRQLTTDGALRLDQENSNNGSLTPGLSFGSNSEGVASKRTAGGNQNGLDFYTNSTLRLSITNAGNIGIGTAALPTAKLEVSGDLKLQQGVAVNEFSSDANLADNSDLAIPTEKAVKAYIGTQITQVNAVLATKAVLNGSASQDFQTKNLTVVGNLEVTGINPATPILAKLQVAGMVGNTVGLFGSDRQGISLVANWPSIGFNAYFNNGWKSITPGWTGNIYLNQDAGGISFQLGQRSTAANAVISFVDRFYVGADGAVSIPGRLNFGAQTRQMINLWKEEYGIGVQSGTTYFRSAANFCWFVGGVHNDTRDNPGSGRRLMALNESGDLILSARTNPTGSPNASLCRALVDAGNTLSINHGNDYSNGVNITNGRFVSSQDLKQDIVNLSTQEATQALQDLRPVKFSYKTDRQRHHHAGFIAEEVPDLLAAQDRKSIGALDVVAVLTKVVQEQQATIATLTERLNVLEAKRQV